MAIRKDLDDMLNNLKGSSPERRTEPTEHSAGRKSIYDTMSVEDLLNALTVEKRPSLAENILKELDGKEKEDVPKTDPEPVSESVQSNAGQKKKVVITGELPDYEELRRQELEQMKQERLRAENRQKFIPAAIPETKENAGESTENTDFRPPADTADTKVMTAVTETSDPDTEFENTMVFQGNAIVQNESEYKDKHENTSEKKDEIYDEFSPEDLSASDEKSDNKPENKEKKIDKKKKKSRSLRNKKHHDQVEEIVEEDKENPDGSATDLIDTALAAIRDADNAEAALEPSVNDAAEEIKDIFAADEAIQELNDSEFIQAIENDSEDQPEDKKDGVSSLIEGIRENAASAIAELAEFDSRDDNEDPENNSSDNDNESQDDSDKKEEKPEKKSRVTTALTKILDEDPETLIDVKREKTEENEDVPVRKKKLKRRIYAVLGVVFTVFAVIGVIAAAGKGIRYFKSFTSGEMKKDSFTELIYPVVIMDIESFGKPADLTSEQIITASIWSIIMDDEKLAKYPVNVAGGDIITISTYDIEAEAVALFGQNHAPFEHTTVGPVTSRFYFDPDKGVYNVPIHPIVFTYEPEIKSIVKSGSQYTLTVDYIDERPAWMEKSVSKSVEFVVTEKSDGTYQFESMKINFVKNNL